jgi:hypothetical protein
MPSKIAVSNTSDFLLILLLESHCRFFVAKSCLMLDFWRRWTKSFCGRCVCFLNAILDFLHARNVNEKGGQVPILNFWKGSRLKIQMWVPNQLPTSCCTVSTCTGIIGDVLLPTCTATLFDCVRSQESLPYQRSWEAWEHPLMHCSWWIQQMHGFICHLVLVSGLSPVNDSVYLHQIQVSAPVYESQLMISQGSTWWHLEDHVGCSEVLADLRL